MKNTSKNSTSKRQSQNDDTLIYILLFLLLALLVGGVVYYFYDRNKQQQIDYDYSELGEKKVAPNAEDVGKLILENRRREKGIRWTLASKNRKVSTSEKNKIEQELEKYGTEHLNKSFYDIDLTKLPPEDLANIYSQLYEQAKLFIRLKYSIGNEKSYEELKKQKEITQTKWYISSSEQEEIDRNLDKWLKAWYNRFMKHELKPELGEVKLSRYIEPRWIDGKKVGANPTPAQIDFFKGMISSFFYTTPANISFRGWAGYVDPNKDSNEGKETHGLTLSPPPLVCSDNKTILPERPKDRELTPEEKAARRRAKMTPGYRKVLMLGENRREITIQLKKELFFNRLGYDEWITKLNNEKRTYTDICFDGIVETIAHELAHAIIQSLRGRYKGERKGGHGKLHDDMTDRVEKMMRATPEFTEFRNWWEKK